MSDMRILAIERSNCQCVVQFNIPGAIVLIFRPRLAYEALRRAVFS
jgi:hypothetical protein